jgi:uroporphyrin-III C-methyltransferase
MAPASAKLVSVAKRRSRHSMPQEEINALLVSEALAGRDVVR